jgi:hypothetical protein
MSAYSNQLLNFTVYLLYFFLVLIGERLEKTRYLRMAYRCLTTSCVIVAVWFYFNQILSATTLVTTRVSFGGVHSYLLTLFGLPFFLFAFKPNLNVTRGVTLTVYLISIHEIFWNLVFYGVVKPYLIISFLTYSSTVSVMVFTVVISIIRYRQEIKVSTLLVLLPMIAYCVAWVSMGFPITVSTFENPQMTRWFTDLFVNMIEIGYSITFVGCFTIAYFLVNEEEKK